MSRKSILIVSYKIPYPVIQGGAIAQFFFLEELVLEYDVTFCTIVNNEYQRGNLKLLQQIIPELKIIYHDQTIVQRYSSNFVNKVLTKAISFSKRVHLFLLKKQFQKQLNWSATNKFDSNFNFADESFLVFFEKLISHNNFSHIQLEFFETLALLPFLPATAKKIVILHEVRSKRNSLIKSSNSIYQHYAVEAMGIIEKAFLRVADEVVVFNENDKLFLDDLGEKVVVSPFGITKSIVEKEVASSFFNKFIFIGAENHFPNKEGVEWFLDTILIPNTTIIDWPIYIIGEWTEATILKYNKYTNIIFTGFLPSLSNHFENSIMLCPILSGSGIRTKILQSFANKIPVIATPFASEGLFESESSINHLIHFESTGDFIAEFLKLKSNQEQIVTIANNGFEYLSRNFDNEELIKNRFKLYQ
ncbi:MAG: glycosyltransferase family 4 protein [Flavobacteriaceae bacterium]|nr:glycosyltransferase family 4 protein [Flavobacteriaceae bacterium]